VQSKKMQKLVFRSALGPNQISFSHSQDPLRKSGGPKCCDAQHGFFNDVVGCDPRLEGST
jgi:hypothetical protein